MLLKKYGDNAVTELSVRDNEDKETSSEAAEGAVCAHGLWRITWMTCGC